MNYRHAFHAGNFADLVKHAGLTLLLEALMAEGSPLVIVDTHAGAGGYDLEGELSRRTGEAAQGIFRLMEAPAPAAFDGLKAAVAGMNPGGGVRFYPGSPRLIAAALRPGDRYTACEVRDDDHALLAQTLAPYPGARAVQADGYETAPATVPPKGRALVLIDPPFERPDDYQRIAAAMAAVRARNPRAVVAVWLPLKDLETFDAFLRSIEGAAPDALIGECRLRKLDNPMKMNGCALVIAGAPAGLEGPLGEVCAWVAGLGEGEGRGEAWRLDG
ncbi:23S rRNA (adenine(2030)-N(6))-methyltransferase RlmJ [Caulobacter sp. NIBR1757]|uniref:23S rRNA (adenine(2030)-N(6))-methyltransferase RlmJ n=1 Tax=Caulobacter sp. NIBR1757 TaxID=3016000 RepID=UPI0022F0F92F|nr:23S rRNA (adenine(2030)-N(6))-methyltransferase RlmJ [Caulobacter sp. NIBR1757]WGM39497.1 Ribosomal RNA large subunit methyltransferase J [Caulobacter sp. NIBR1757]